MPKKSSTASQLARQAAREGAKYTTALRRYSADRTSAQPREDSSTIASENLFQKVADVMAGLGLGNVPDVMAGLGLGNVPDVTEAQRHLLDGPRITEAQRHLLDGRTFFEVRHTGPGTGRKPVQSPNFSTRAACMGPSRA